MLVEIILNDAWESPGNYTKQNILKFVLLEQNFVKITTKHSEIPGRSKMNTNTSVQPKINKF